MLLTTFHGNRSAGSRKVFFTIYGRDSHLGEVFNIIFTYVLSLYATNCMYSLFENGSTVSEKSKIFFSYVDYLDLH